MNRRQFLHSVAGLLGGTAITRTAGANLSDDWWEQVTEVDHLTVHSEEGTLRLRVELFFPSGEEIEQRPAEDGETTRFYYRGKRLPDTYWPTCSLLHRFDFFWNDQQIDVPRRFWADLCRLRLQMIEPSPPGLSDQEQVQFADFVSRLDQPHVFLSADGGTALVEWERPEDCDRHSMIRWMISKKGTVLRHTFTPPDEC
ncbi:MAG: hypothetical protein ABI680_16220 [Chthoniobacteraceae bacterium]